MGIFDKLFNKQSMSSDSNYEISEKDKIILNFLNFIQLQYGISQLIFKDNNLAYKINEVENAKLDWTKKAYDNLNMLNRSKIFVELVDFSKKRAFINSVKYYAERSRIFMALIGYYNIIGIQSRKEFVDDPRVIAFDKEMKNSYDNINIGIQGLFEYQHKYKFNNFSIYSKYYLTGLRQLLNYENIPFIATDPRISMYLYAYYTTKDGPEYFMPSTSHVICWIYNMYKYMFSIDIALIASLIMFITLTSKTMHNNTAEDLANNIPYMATLDRMRLRFSITSLNNNPDSYTVIGINDNERNIIFGL